MGLQFRKSKKIRPFRITASKCGIGASVDVKGARIAKRADGRTRTTLTMGFEPDRNREVRMVREPAGIGRNQPTKKRKRWPR